MGNERKGARIGLAVVMILFGLFCVVVLTEGFTVWFLLLALAGIGGGIFNLLRTLAIKRVKKEPKNSSEGFNL